MPHSKVFDLGESSSGCDIEQSDKWFPRVSLKDTEAMFDDDDINNEVGAFVKLRLKEITKRSSDKDGPFEHSFEILELQITEKPSDGMLSEDFYKKVDTV